MGKLLLALTLLGAACATTSARRDREAELAAAPTAEAKGRILYESSCQRCHDLHMPSSYSAGDWAFYLRKYGRRARLSRQERDLVYAYLRTHARSWSN